MNFHNGISFKYYITLNTNKKFKSGYKLSVTISYFSSIMGALPSNTQNIRISSYKSVDQINESDLN